MSYAAVIGAVGTVAAGALTASQSGSGGTGAGSGAISLPDFESKVGTEDSYAGKMVPEANRNLDMALPAIFGVVDKVNPKLTRMRDKKTGGAFSESIKQEGANLRAFEKGFVPGDVQDSIHRLAAEHLGGAYDPSMGGDKSQFGSKMARMLGLTSLQLSQWGMSFGQGWRSNVDSFIYKPQEAARDFYFPMLQAGLQASELQNKIDENTYSSAVNKAFAEAGAPPTGGMGGAGMGQAVASGAKGLAALIPAIAGGSSSSTAAPSGTYMGTSDASFPQAGLPVYRPEVAGSSPYVA
jgi:hypothetical protein